jgi:signal transduction histidine kinase
MKPTQSIKTRMAIWYLGSIVLIGLFFWFGVHAFSIPYGTEIFMALLVLLSLVGYLVINQLIGELSSLTQKIKAISSKNLDQRLRHSHNGDEVSQLADTFNDLLDRLESSFERERQFIGDVAHEIKTPIATMKSAIEVALTKRRSESEYKMLFADLLEDIDNLTLTLSDVLDLAWTEAHSDKKFTKTVNLSDLLEELVEIATNLASGKNVEIYFEIEPKVTIHGNREKLARAFLNLINNAIQYNKVGGKVYISLKQKQHAAVFKVKDTGLGIPKKDLEGIFKRFYRGSNVSAIKGSGLGLAIVKSIIQIHDGEIDVTSSEKKGTLFTISLPLA